MGMFDLWPMSKKEKKVAVIKENQMRGKAAEDDVVMSYTLRGYDMERTGRGSDFKARRRDLFTGRVRETKYVEVKSGNAKLSKLQQRNKRKGNYKVERIRNTLI